MVLIKVRYDAYNRQFTLLDSALARTLVDGESYLLVADMSVEDRAPAASVQIAGDVQPVMV